VVVRGSSSGFKPDQIDTLSQHEPTSPANQRGFQRFTSQLVESLPICSRVWIPVPIPVAYLDGEYAHNRIDHQPPNPQCPSSPNFVSHESLPGLTMSCHNTYRCTRLSKRRHAPEKGNYDSDYPYHSPFIDEWPIGGGIVWSYVPVHGLLMRPRVTLDQDEAWTLGNWAPPSRLYSIPPPCCPPLVCSFKRMPIQVRPQCHSSRPSFPLLLRPPRFYSPRPSLMPVSVS
jgi:hypothetical protein